MFNRRLHMLFPQRAQAEDAVQELLLAGISPSDIHAIAKDGVELGDLPRATVRQQRDWLARCEDCLWSANLAIFFVALLFALVMLLLGEFPWAGIGIGIMLATFLLGNYFAAHVPHTHLAHHHAALQHGEILLLVDLPHWRVNSLEARIHRRHPEMEVGGVSWTLGGLGA